MVYLVDIVQGEAMQRYVASHVREVFPLIANESPESPADFLVRIQKVEQIPGIVREALRAAAG